MIADDGGAAGPEDPGEPGDGGETPELDALLRDERAAVAVTVALASGATTYADRTRLELLGGELVLLCGALRERLELAGRAVPSGASPQAGAMLATESYGARLAALADFLDATAAHATAALAASDDGEYTRTLRDLISTHARSAEWLRGRAAAFAATRPRDEGPHNPADPNAPAPGTVFGQTSPGAGAEPARGDPRADDDDTTP